MSSFNTFGSSKKEFGSGKNVWYEVTGKWPGGGSVTNLSDFDENDVIPAGSMVVFDHAKHQAKIVKATDVKTATNTGGTVEPKTINGLLENDIWVEMVRPMQLPPLCMAARFMQTALPKKFLRRCGPYFPRYMLSKKNNKNRIIL